MSRPASTWVEWRGIGMCSGDERQEKTADLAAVAAYEEALEVDPNNSKIYHDSWWYT